MKTWAAEQGVAPVEALELKVLYVGLRIINVRLAGERHCSADEQGGFILRV